MRLHVGAGAIDARLYLQLNEYAHQRFPENLSFVHNLLSAYGRRETWNPAGSDRLLIFLLCAYAPEQFQERQVLDHRGKLDIAETIAKARKRIGER